MRTGRHQPISQRQKIYGYAGLGAQGEANRRQELGDPRIPRRLGTAPALVESAWRLVRTSPKWAAFFSRLRQRSGSKRAIVAVARKLLCVLYAMLKTSTPYQVIPTQTKTPKIKRVRSVKPSTA